MQAYVFDDVLPPIIKLEYEVFLKVGTEGLSNFYIH